MKTGAWVAGLVTVLALALVPRTADACGYWKMTDVERKRAVGWLWNAGTITTTGKAERRLGALYLDTEHADGVRVVASRKVVFDIKDGKLRKRGKVIGTVDATTITLGKAVFAVELGPQIDFHGIPGWSFVVKRDGAVVLQSEAAAALCLAVQHGGAGGSASMMPIDAQQHEVVRRIAYYLAWRERGPS